MNKLCTFTRVGDKLISYPCTVHSDTLNIRTQLSAINKRFLIDNEILSTVDGHTVNYRHIITNKKLGKLPNFLRVVRQDDDTYDLFVNSEHPFLRACADIEKARGGVGVILDPSNPKCEGVMCCGYGT